MYITEIFLKTVKMKVMLSLCHVQLYKKMCTILKNMIFFNFMNNYVRWESCCNYKLGLKLLFIFLFVCIILFIYLSLHHTFINFYEYLNVKIIANYISIQISLTNSTIKKESYFNVQFPLPFKRKVIFPLFRYINVTTL